MQITNYEKIINLIPRNLIIKFYIYEEVDLTRVIFVVVEFPATSEAKLCGGGGGLWCITSLSSIFQLYHGGQFYCGRKLEKTTDLPKVTYNLYHVMLYQVHLAIDRIQTHNCCICSFKSNYHTITTMTTT